MNAEDRKTWRHDEGTGLIRDGQGRTIAAAFAETFNAAVARAATIANVIAMHDDLLAACELVLAERPRTAAARQALEDVIARAKETSR